MTFANLLAGDSIFVDANILIYHFTPHPTLGATCDQLMVRIDNGEIHGFTSAHVLGEVAHQLMIAEAMTLPGWSAGKVAQKLRQQPSVVQNLTLFRKAVEDVLLSTVQVLPILSATLADAVVLSQRYGLLTNDALILAVMQSHGLTRIASLDPDFDRVPGITRYEPT